MKNKNPQAISLLILIALISTSCGISQQDVDATIAALPTQTQAATMTPNSYQVIFEVRSSIVTDPFHDNLWEITWGLNRNESSFTYTSIDLFRQGFEPGYNVHWTETIEARSGDTVRLEIEGYPESFMADCAIIVFGQDVSLATKGIGGGSASCEYTLP